MKLTCYLREGIDIDIRPAASRRRWMDETLRRAAYRCLPLTIANSHGWTICCGKSFEAEWNGGRRPEDVRIFDAGEGDADVFGHFGTGILTFSTGVIFRTPPGYNLYVTGPTNRFKDGIQPMSAVVESDWIPFPFTMNWKLTRPDLRVRFDRGEPYCHLFPVKRHLLENLEPEIREVASDPELERQCTAASMLRGLGPMARSLDKGGVSDWQGWYMRGQLPDGSRDFDDHQRALSLKPFVRREVDEK